MNMFKRWLEQFVALIEQKERIKTYLNDIWNGLPKEEQKEMAKIIESIIVKSEVPEKIEEEIESIILKSDKNSFDGLSDSYLEEVNKRCKNITRGPWDSTKDFSVVTSLGSDNYIVRMFQKCGGLGVNSHAPSDEESKANAEFIANAREDIPKLLNEIHRLKEYILSKDL